MLAASFYVAPSLAAILFGCYICAANEIHKPRPDVSHGPCKSLHIAITSVAHYDRPRARLLQSMRAAGVPMGQVHVFLGGTTATNRGLTTWLGDNGTNYHAVPHNSIDFTAMIHIVENPELFRGIRTWFYLHDTTEVGRTFWRGMALYCNGIPSCAVPLTRSESSRNIGLYDARFLTSHTASLVSKKNRDNERVRYMKSSVEWEDDLFHRCDTQQGMVHRVCPTAWRMNGLCARESHAMCSSISHKRRTVRVYGNTSAPRIAFLIKCIDLIKYTTNTRKTISTMAMVPKRRP